MNIIDTRKQEREEALFQNLKIGEVYEDKDGYVCIKVSENLCLFADEYGIWDRITEGADEKVYPLAVNLEILGYKMI